MLWLSGSGLSRGVFCRAQRSKQAQKEVRGQEGHLTLTQKLPNEYKEKTKCKEETTDSDLLTLTAVWFVVLVRVDFKVKMPNCQLTHACKMVLFGLLWPQKQL